MARVVWTSIAESELQEILRFIRVDGQRPETAERLGHEFQDAVDDHARRELPGCRHQAMPEGWRYLKFKRWLVGYIRVDDDYIVQRIVDASRDLPGQFKRDP